jgi:hypothetical protein
LKPIANYSLSGPAVEAFEKLLDDNGDSPADETRAIANFNAFLPNGIETARRFIKKLEKVSGQAR